MHLVQEEFRQSVILFREPGQLIELAFCQKHLNAQTDRDPREIHLTSEQTDIHAEHIIKPA